jgi:hypothetical protein
MKKIVLALHGIGDQTRNETVLAAGVRFRGFFRDRTPLSLGEFHRVLEDGRPPFDLAGMGFAEIYWADIPRKVVDEGYTLQETKAWARSVVERVEAAGIDRLAGVDYDRVKDVLEELITTIAVLEALTFLAKKAGVMDFNLRKLLDDYIGDVQLVVEFSDLRQRVLDRFETKLRNANGFDPEAEIYLVTHSEGTVIALLCLLAAATSPNPPAWLGQVRGFMTLGSPIGKHLVLWPELFARFTGLPNGAPKPRIPWMNYYDLGDPVGFELDIARDWLSARGYDGLFDFPPENDIGFSRYYLPGKAHTDYWDDGAVFGHFISRVVDPGDPRPRPRSSPVASVVSYVATYAAYLAVAGAAAYVLYRGIGMTLDLQGKASHVAHNVAALTALLAGITAGLRISRLTRSRRWAAAAAGVMVAGIGVYCLLSRTSPELAWLSVLAGPAGGGPRFKVLFGAVAVAALGKVVSGFDQLFHSATGRRRHFRFFGATVGVGALALLATAAVNLVPASGRVASDRLWPAILSGAAFIYLWWLSALLFDLVFVWQRYIRTSLVVKILRKPFERIVRG